MGIKTIADLLTVDLQEISEVLEIQAENTGNGVRERETYTMLLRLTKEIITLKEIESQETE